MLTTRFLCPSVFTNLSTMHTSSLLLSANLQPSTPPHPPPGLLFSLQHLSLIWNEEEMPPCGLTSGPSWGLAEIDVCDPAVLIYSPHTHRGVGDYTVRCWRGREADRERKWKGESELGRGRESERERAIHLLVSATPFIGSQSYGAARTAFDDHYLLYANCWCPCSFRHIHKRHVKTKCESLNKTKRNVPVFKLIHRWEKQKSSVFHWQLKICIAIQHDKHMSRLAVPPVVAEIIDSCYLNIDSIIILLRSSVFTHHGWCPKSTLSRWDHWPLLSHQQNIHCGDWSQVVDKW